MYVFQGSELVTWYAQSNLIAFRGKLYHVVYEQNNLLASYAWLIDQKIKDARYALVIDSDLRCYLHNGNMLKIHGSTVDRYIGSIRAVGNSHVICIQMIPPNTWWQSPTTYWTDLKTLYAPQDQITGKLLKIQRILKERSKLIKTRRYNTLRNLGWFAVLNDDLFQLIMQKTLKEVSHRWVRLRLELPPRLRQ